MSTISIYDPRIKAYAELHGVSDLQAYRALNAREVLRLRLEEQRRAEIGAGLRATYK